VVGGKVTGEDVVGVAVREDLGNVVDGAADGADTGPRQAANSITVTVDAIRAAPGQILTTAYLPHEYVGDMWYSLLESDSVDRPAAGRPSTVGTRLVPAKGCDAPRPLKIERGRVARLSHWKHPGA
jgi:hypothetical protein